MTFGSPATLMMSGACPPPAPSVWKAWIVRPAIAAMVSSTKPALVQRVGVDHHLHVHRVGDRQAAVDRRRRRAPVLVQLQRAGAGPHHLLERRGPRGVALAGDADVDRHAVDRLQHPADVPRPRRAGGGERAVRRPGAAAEQRRHARVQRVVDLLRADEVDVRVEAAGGEDPPLAGDDLGARADDDRHAWLGVGVAGLADRGDPPVPQPDVGLVDAGPVEDQRVGDDRVDRALGARGLRLAHAVADRLAAAELHLLAVDGQVALDLDDQLGVGEPHPVAGGRPVHVGVGDAGDAGGHRRTFRRAFRASERHAHRDGVGIGADEGGRIGVGPKPSAR